MENQQPNPYVPQNQNTPNPQQSNPGYVNQNNFNVVIDPGFVKKPKNKWVALLLCFFFGLIGAHKFYEEKTGMGILYLFTGGLFCIGAIVDFIVLIFKPTHYTV